MLVPALEVFELSDHSLPCYYCTSMIDSRRVMTGGHLRRVHIEMVMTDDWFVDADTLSRLRKFRREGLVISIVNVMNHLDLLDSYDQPVIRDG